ncbi:Uncharacterised protein [Vibrio cholerae]|nr:Uncharacterised protein [Vibrio cholerae]
MISKLISKTAEQNHQLTVRVILLEFISTCEINTA